MGTSTDTDDIESFWEGLRPQRDLSTLTNVPIVDVVALEDPVESDEESTPYVTRYTIDYGDDSPVEVEESNVTFTSVVTDPPYSHHLSGTERSNGSLFRELVYTTVRLRNLLNSAGIRYNFTRLIDVIDSRVQDLNIGPEDPRLSYFQEMSDLLSNSEDDHARR